MSSVEPGRQVLGHAAGAEIVGVQPRARDALVELHQLLALLEPPQERRHRADIQREGVDVQQVVQDAGDLGEQHADVLRARRRRRSPSASRPPARRRAPGTSARRNRAGRNTGSPADRSCTRSASRCRDAAGRYADRRARRPRRPSPGPGAARHAPPDAAARNSSCSCRISTAFESPSGGPAVAGVSLIGHAVVSDAAGAASASRAACTFSSPGRAGRCLPTATGNRN